MGENLKSLFFGKNLISIKHANFKNEKVQTETGYKSNFCYSCSTDSPLQTCVYIFLRN